MRALSSSSGVRSSTRCERLIDERTDASSARARARGRRQHEQPRIAQRVDVRVRAGDELVAVAQQARQPRRFALAEQDRGDVERGDIGMARGRHVKADGEVRLADVAVASRPRAVRSAPARRRGAASGRPVGIAAEPALDAAPHAHRIDVAGDDERHVVGDVVAAEELDSSRSPSRCTLSAVPITGRRYGCATNAVANRLCATRARRIVAALADLLEDHLALARELVGIDARRESARRRSHRSRRRRDRGRAPRDRRCGRTTVHALISPPRALDRARQLADAERTSP